MGVCLLQCSKYILPVHTFTQCICFCNSGAEKLGFSKDVQGLLAVDETDGTEIDDFEMLAEMPSAVILLLQPGQQWQAKDSCSIQDTSAASATGQDAGGQGMPVFQQAETPQEAIVTEESSQLLAKSPQHAAQSTPGTSSSRKSE